MEEVKWECPNCNVGHEDGEGFYCDCEGLVFSELHGISHSDPCINATCCKCGWIGEFPLPKWSSSNLKGWARKAWNEGWRPPRDWKPNETTMRKKRQ